MPRGAQSRGRIIGNNDGRRIDIEDRDSRGAQTADDAEDKSGQAKALPQPFAAQRAIDQFFLDDLLFTRHASHPALTRPAGPAG